jgi:hypothetical protein
MLVRVICDQRLRGDIVQCAGDARDGLSIQVAGTVRDTRPGSVIKPCVP